MYIQQDATLTVYFIWKLLYMFRVVPLPIIRSETTVSTASGICHTVIAICRYRGRVGTGVGCAVGGVPDAVDTVVSLLMLGDGTTRNM
jgi:hypothetical protein